MIFYKFQDNIHYNLKGQFQKNRRNCMSNFAWKNFCTNLVLSHGTWMLIKTKRNYLNIYHRTCCSSELLPQVITRLNSVDFKRLFCGPHFRLINLQKHIDNCEINNFTSFSLVITKSSTIITEHYSRLELSLFEPSLANF